MMTSQRTQNILPGLVLSLLAIVVFTNVANAQDVQSATGTVRGAVGTAGPDGVSYNLPGANIKLKQGTQTAETSANDAGEYEFAADTAHSTFDLGN